MAPHSSTLAWKIPWTEEPVHGVARSQTRLSDFTLTFHFHALEEEMPSVGESPWKRKHQPMPVFLPGELQGQRSLVSYSPWGPKESEHD